MLTKFSINNTLAETPAKAKERVMSPSDSLIDVLIAQTGLLMWKRWCEITARRWSYLVLILQPLLVFSLMDLLYYKFTFYPGGIEEFLVPLGFLGYLQMIVVLFSVEKCNKLQESMKMMGMLELPYFTAYFLVDGFIVGFIISLLSSLISLYGLFNDAPFGTIFGLLLIYCLSVVPFAYSISTLFDSAQTASQAGIFSCFILYVIYLVVDIKGESGNQGVACLFPPLALQIASGSFKKSYTGISVSGCCGILVLDVFLWSVIGWYLNQVVPSQFGTKLPWHFPFHSAYWFPVTVNEDTSTVLNAIRISSTLMDQQHLESADAPAIPAEAPNETLLGEPTVTVNKLKKTYGDTTVVNEISFNMYENQIFALLGHNGAGKTTTISMLSGLIGSDYKGGTAHIYGNSIVTNMMQVRSSLGVCPQHDVLFENLTVEQHILLFGRLKGQSYVQCQDEVDYLARLFKLDERLHHTGGQLSGGQKRKLSVSIAICGGSKFVILDEPTASMDPLARREIWDLLASLRTGRTMLLTTHYMDEADVLGDRIAIMNLGKLQCVGSPQFLKTYYGAGYKLVFEPSPSFNKSLHLPGLTKYVCAAIPDATYSLDDELEGQIGYNLPFKSIAKFGGFFTDLETSKGRYFINDFGVTITSMEDVFLKVGEDHSVKPNQQLMETHGIGKNTEYKPNFYSQAYGIFMRRLMIAAQDYYVTVPLLLLPLAATSAAAALYKNKTVSDLSWVNCLTSSAIIMAGYFGVPGLIAEFQVRERADRLRNVLTVAGCDFQAYWLGSFLSDYVLMSVVLIGTWISWGAGDMESFIREWDEDDNYPQSSSPGLAFFLMMVFMAQIIGFSYAFSFIFTSPAACMAFMPMLVLLSIFIPTILIIIVAIIIEQVTGTFTTSGGPQLWGTMIVSPLGALFSGLLDCSLNLSSKFDKNVFPSIGATLAFMIVETVLYIMFAYYIDSSTVSPVTLMPDPTFDSNTMLQSLDNDVASERVKVLNDETKPCDPDVPLRVVELRKVYPPKRTNMKPVVAAENVTFQVQRGEIFGLLGANGAGKTTTLSMLTRHTIPTCGNAYVTGHSVLTNFLQGAASLGVVTQNNSLWDLLSVESHLYLFARLRGIPEANVKAVVDSTIDELELSPHRHKRSMNLSGGMKRKLCVAIALIGDPTVVLLDEISAGLDPVSRRNLWRVILKTMSHRSVILTTHSMEEAEVLCKRIGIMVKGQLRALGTKQHLKSKFGSGYELVVKLQVKDFVKQTAKLEAFILSIFPNAKMLAENGGLVTYHIPASEMRIGMAFSRLYESKVALDIEEFIFSQPTLEQVFIKTVITHSPEELAASPLRAQLLILDSSRKSSISVHSGDFLGTPDDEYAGGQVVEEPNRCGWRPYWLKRFAAFFTLLFIIFVIVMFSPSGRYLFFPAIIVLVIACTFCNCLCCSCCNNPKDQD